MAYPPKTQNGQTLLDKLKFQSEVINAGKQTWLPLNSEKSKLSFNRSVLMTLHSSAPYDKAGYWYRTTALLTALKSHQVSVVCATRAGYPWDLRKHKDLPKVESEMVDNTLFFRLSAGGFPYKRGADLKYINGYAQQLTEIAKAKKASVIHGHSNYLNGLAAIKAARDLGCNSVYEARGFWHMTQEAKTPGYKTTEQYDYESKMERYALELADKVVTLSHAMKALITSWGIESDKIHVVPNAVDTMQFSPTVKQACVNLTKSQLPDNHCFTIGFIGSLTVYEGLDVLIKAVVSLRHKGHNIQLVIVGSGPMESELTSMAMQHDCVHMVGSVAHEEVIAWYAQFDLCAYPRTDDEVCRYVPPMKVLEAMSMEIPVVVSDLPPLTEMVDDMSTGLVCTSVDLNSLAKCLEFGLSHPKELERIASNARTWVMNNRTWHQNARRYESLYNTFK
ncbi:glycosyltransferase family 4 protein [Vibrio sp. HN007]|uniref:glycosyltransferase family 4 protein n=1 Tax=Vibrio iocasae TaxID=3098914 RepID=UPI0035D4F09B